MRVFILSATAGFGHNATAHAIADELSARGVEVQVEDMYESTSRLRYRLLDQGYEFSINHMPKRFGKTYAQLENHGRMRRIVSAINNNRRMEEKIADFFKSYRPDVIIATHVIGAQLLNELKRQGLLTMPIIGVVTDYCFHPFWEEVDCIEYIITADEALSATAALKGMDVNKLRPFGLPVRPQFREREDKRTARERLGLDPDRRTVLVMGGSMGFGNIVSVVEQVDAMALDIQLVCVCGRNQKLFKTLEALKTSKTLHLKSFISNVDEYMDASDCIITKPGGLTVTEAMAKKLPMILINPIPGWEERNVEFLLNSGAAIRVTEGFSVSEAVYLLFAKPQRLELMERAIELIAKPDATEKISDFIMGL